MKLVRGVVVAMLATVVTLGLGAAVPAQASTTGPDTDAALKGLTAAQLATATLATEATTTQGAGEVTVEAAAAKESCWYIHSAQSGVLKVLGKKSTLWTMEQIVNYCGKSGKVTRVTAVQEKFTHLSSLVDVKTKPHHTTSKPSAQEWVVRTEARLQVCVPLKCIGTYYPWIDAYLYGNGKRSANGGF